MMAIYIMSVLYIHYISSLPNIDVSKPSIMHMRAIYSSNISFHRYSYFYLALVSSKDSSNFL